MHSVWEQFWACSLHLVLPIFVVRSSSLNEFLYVHWLNSVYCNCCTPYVVQMLCFVCGVHQKTWDSFSKKDAAIVSTACKPQKEGTVRTYICMSVLWINWCTGIVFFFEPKLQYSKACNSIGPFVVFFLKPWTLITYVRINIRRIRDTYIWWRVFSDTSLNVLKTLSTVLQVYSRQTVKTIQAT